jgi:hypothetical protein
MTAAQVSLAELIRAGITPNADAAVAIVRALIRERSSSAASLPTTDDTPLSEDIYLAPDGTVLCGNGQRPALSDVALFLRQLLPAGAAIPGGLQYAIARALLEVDAPPFGSVEEFSSALARFERSDRGQAVRGLVEKAQTHVRTTSRPLTDRRRTTSTSFSDLRRALHEADTKLFEQQAALEALAAARPARTWNRLAVAACLSAAAAGSGAGYVLHERLVTRTPATTTAQSVGAPVSAAAHTVQPRDIVLTAPVKRSAQKLSAGTQHVTSKPGVRRASQAGSSESKGIFKRLRLQWLRKAFSGRT